MHQCRAVWIFTAEFPQTALQVAKRVHDPPTPTPTRHCCYQVGNKRVICLCSVDTGRADLSGAINNLHRPNLASEPVRFMAHRLQWMSNVVLTQTKKK